MSKIINGTNYQKLYYYKKYVQYKNKYIQLKKMQNGGSASQSIYNITVLTLSGQQQVLVLKSNITIKELKQIITIRLNTFRWYQMRLMSNGRQLNDDQLLSSIGTTFTCHVVGRVGVPHPDLFNAGIRYNNNYPEAFEIESNGSASYNLLEDEEAALLEMKDDSNLNEALIEQIMQIRIAKNNLLYQILGDIHSLPPRQEEIFAEAHSELALASMSALPSALLPDLSSMFSMSVLPSALQPGLVQQAQSLPMRQNILNKAVVLSEDKSTELEKEYENRINCQICYVNARNISLDPCHHTMCIECYDKINPKRCPDCRKTITDIHPFYLGGYKKK